MKLNVVGLGHPTKWHVSVQDEFKTKEEAEALKARLESNEKLAVLLQHIDLEDVYVKLWNSHNTELAHKISELMRAS